MYNLTRQLEQVRVEPRNGKASCMKIDWNRVLPIAFIIIGVIDFTYGIMKKDQVSLAMGAIMVGIAVFILVKDRQAS